MFKEFLKLMWLCTTVTFALAVLGILIYNHGIIGWFMGVGFIATVLIADALVGATANLIVNGKFTTYVKITARIPATVQEAERGGWEYDESMGYWWHINGTCYLERYDGNELRIVGWQYAN